MGDLPRSEHSITITRWGWNNTHNELYGLTYKNKTYTIFPKTTLAIIGLTGLAWTLVHMGNQARKQTFRQYKRDKKIREETIQEICGTVKPEVVKTYIDTIAHLEERKQRHKSELEFAKNEAKYKSLFQA